MLVSNLHQPHLLLKRNTCTCKFACKKSACKSPCKNLHASFFGGFYVEILHIARNLRTCKCCNAYGLNCMFMWAGDLHCSTVCRRLHWKLEFQRLSAHKIQVASFNFGWKLTQESGKPQQFCFRSGHVHSSQCSVPVSQNQVIRELFISADCETAVKLRSQTIFFTLTLCKLNSTFCRWNKCPSRLWCSHSQFVASLNDDLILDLCGVNLKYIKIDQMKGSATRVNQAFMLLTLK